MERNYAAEYRDRWQREQQVMAIVREIEARQAAARVQNHEGVGG